MNLNQFNNVLIAYWNLDEVSGDRIDCVKSQNLSSIGNTASTTGINNNAALFNGDSFLYTQHSDLLGDSEDPKGFMFSTWVYFDKNNQSLHNDISNSIIAEKDPYFSISTQNLSNDRKWLAKISNVIINTSAFSLATTNVWYHIMIGASNGVLFFSVHPCGGSLQYSSSTYNSLIAQRTYFYIGKTMKGKIDESAFWYNPSVDSIDEFIEIEKELYNNGIGLFYNCHSDLWEFPVTANSLTTNIPSAITPNTTQIESLKRVITYMVKNGQEIPITDSSSSRSTINSYNANSISFGVIAPGDSEKKIIKLEVPDALVIKNIKLGLVDSGNIPIQNISVSTNTIIDDYTQINGKFTGYSDGKDSENNVSVSNFDRTSSYYVYLKISVPVDFRTGSDILKVCWYFEYA